MMRIKRFVNVLQALSIGKRMLMFRLWQRGVCKPRLSLHRENRAMARPNPGIVVRMTRNMPTRINFFDVE